jgi:uncharacterized protein YgiM (DUF1202 family)
MQKQRVTGLLLAGVILAFLLGNPRAMAGQPADAPRAPEPSLPPSKEAATSLTSLALDVSQAVTGTRNGKIFVAFPLADGTGFVLSSDVGDRDDGVSSHKVGSADDKSKPKAKQPQPARVPELDPNHAKEYHPEKAPLAVVCADDVNVREKPDLKSKTVASLQEGDRVYLVSISGPWYYVSIPSKKAKGFVFGSFLAQLKEVVINGDQVNLRAEPSTNAKVLQKLPKGARFVRLGESSKFYRVISPTKGYEGWVSKDLCTVSQPELPRYKVAADEVNFRKTPNVDADIIGQLGQGAEVKTLGRDEKWSLVSYNGKQGWIYSEYLVPAKQYYNDAPRGIGEKLVSRGMDLRGVRYTWGGESPSGFDCSGFVYYLLHDQFGMKNLPRRASEQYYQMGTPVDKEDLRPGDLVFFTTYKKGPSHVGVYIGDGNFVHASSAGGMVRVSSLSEHYYKTRLIGARRITNDDLKKYGSK